MRGAFAASHAVAAIVSAPPPPAPSTASHPPRPARSENNPLAGAWLLRDLPNPKPALSLLAHEEAADVRKLLIERGYLIGSADGVWGPRSHAALEDFRRAQELASNNDGGNQAQTALVLQPTQETDSPVMAETGGPVEEEAAPPPQPSTSGTGLGDQAMNDLPPDEVGDAAPEPRLAVYEDTAPEPRLAAHLGQVGAETTYIGVWARSRADCFRTERGAPPLAISAQHAESFGGLAGKCQFAQVQQEGAGWRTRARCSADGRSWTANVQLKVTGSTLIWSSERGRATYYRCG
jgi:hypothetical protein